MGEKRGGRKIEEGKWIKVPGKGKEEELGKRILGEKKMLMRPEGLRIKEKCKLVRKYN